MEKKTTQRALSVGGPALLGPLGIPLSIINDSKWKKEKENKWKEACQNIKDGLLAEAKEMFEAIGAEYGWSDMVYEKIMEIHDKMDGKENIVAARNIAIHLIGSDDERFRNQASTCYERNTDRLLESGFTTTIAPGSRKYIFIGENSDSIGGAYLMDKSKQAVNWFFDLERMPSDLVFQKGHPQPGLYMSHPLLPNYYYPRKNIEHVLFEEKMLEFIKLVQCLGATRIRFQSKRGMTLSQDKTFNANIETKVGVKLINVMADPNGKYKKQNKDDSSYFGEREIRLSPKKKIYIPDNLVWYNSDPEWESIVRGRMDRSLEHYDINISTKETNIISKELDTKVKSNFHYLLIGIKGNFDFNTQEVFTQDEETEWSIHVDFAPLDEDLVPIAPQQSQPLPTTTPTQQIGGASQPAELSSTTPSLLTSAKEEAKEAKETKKNWVIWVMGGVIAALTIGLIIALL